MSKIRNIKGQRFSRLIAREYIGVNKNRLALWLCDCDCGNKTITAGIYLRTGETKSCGCYSSYITAKRNYKHGMTKTRLYQTYRNIIQRCYDPLATSYEHYGGRGISVCCEWLYSPQAFIDWSFKNGYAENLTIDRINNNGNYEPCNCRWVDRNVQANNKRNNHIVVIDGVEKNLKEWANEVGINHKSFADRIKRGWTGQRLLTPPRRSKKEGGEPD